MSSLKFTQFARWTFYLSAAAALLQIVTGLLFISIGGIFGPITDGASVLQAVSMIAVALVLHHMLRSEDRRLSLLTVFIAILSMLVVSVLQSFLVVGIRTYDQVTLPVITAVGAGGIWLLLVNYLAQRRSVFPRGVIQIGLIAGAGFLVQMVSFWIWEIESPLYFIGSSAGYIGYLVWAIWLGRSTNRYE